MQVGRSPLPRIEIGPVPCHLSIVSYNSPGLRHHSRQHPIKISISSRCPTRRRCPTCNSALSNKSPRPSLFRLFLMTRSPSRCDQLHGWLIYHLFAGPNRAANAAAASDKAVKLAAKRSQQVFLPSLFCYYPVAIIISFISWLRPMMRFSLLRSAVSI